MLHFLQAAGGSNALIGNVVMIGGMFAIIYFLMIRPQQKRQKEHQKMIDALGKGDKILTTGGLYGVIVGTNDDIVVIKIAENVKVEIARANIAGVAK